MARGASARRHAQAVFAIAREQDRLEAWASDLEAIAVALGDAVVAQALESPRIPLAQKMAMVRTSLTNTSPLALNLAQLLVLKGRVRLAPDIAEEYRRLLDASRGIERAQVTTAVPLQGDEVVQLGRRLGQIRDRQVSVTHQMDPTIVGGMVARIGDKLMNGSVQARLASLKKRLAEG
ncbi:MAG: ATP synthase F1 subunit delta [Chloroflexi bacterium]|nr:ATP synthase F1 subunit delta [Chloroflexota bacterium]